MQKVFINQGAPTLKSIVKDINIKKIFLIKGTKSFKSKKKILNTFTKGISLEIFTIKDSNYKTIIQGSERLKKSNSDLVVAIGGGRIIDAAKLISTAKITNKNYLNIILGNEKIINKFKPLLVMPTTIGTGSEATEFSVMYFKKEKYSIVSKSLLPNYVVADILLTKNMPKYLKACSIFDAFSQAIESFWCLSGTYSSKKNSKEAIITISQNIKNYFNHNNIYTSKKMIRAAYLSGLAINETRTTLPHALSYFLTIKFGIPHGHAVALTLRFIAKLNFNLGDEILKKRMTNLAKILNIKIENFENYWISLMRFCGLKVNLSSLGIKKSDLKSIVNKVNYERMQNHPIKIEKKLLLKELFRIL